MLPATTQHYVLTYCTTVCYLKGGFTTKLCRLLSIYSMTYNCHLPLMKSFITPTKAKIKDKGLGKSDWLAKSLILLQTLWFVVQCIAHTCKHLVVTHLEIVTLAYATMNFVIYIFWWNKPQHQLACSSVLKIGFRCSIKWRSTSLIWSNQIDVEGNR